MRIGARGIGAQRSLNQNPARWKSYIWMPTMLRRPSWLLSKQAARASRLVGASWFPCLCSVDRGMLHAYTGAARARKLGPGARKMAANKPWCDAVLGRVYQYVFILCFFSFRFISGLRSPLRPPAASSSSDPQPRTGHMAAAPRVPLRQNTGPFWNTERAVRNAYLFF